MKDSHRLSTHEDNEIQGSPSPAPSEQMTDFQKDALRLSQMQNQQDVTMLLQTVQEGYDFLKQDK